MIAAMLCACTHDGESVAHNGQDIDLVGIIARDTLRVTTMTGPTSYFYYRDQPMGYDYDLATDFAEFLGVNLDVIVARTPKEMLHLLRSGEADLIAYNIAPLRVSDEFCFWPIHERSPLVLLQNSQDTPVNSISELGTTKIHIVHNSIYEQHLGHLNQETGGEIRMVLEADSLSDEDIIMRVNNGSADATIIYQNQYPLYRKKYPNLRQSVQLSIGLSTGWMTNSTTVKLNGMIEKWLQDMPDKRFTTLRRKYFVRNASFLKPQKVVLVNGAISVYDDLFHKYAPHIGWDWRLLASLCYHESRFNPNTTSPMGAKGLMQLVPVTAKRFGLTYDNAYEPEASVSAGTQYIKYLQMVYSSVEDIDERVKFVLASYNAGPAHILDARALARKYGKNPDVWDDVEQYLLLKSDPKYYNDPVCKYGYYRGGSAAGYVRKVMNTFELYKQAKS